MKMRQNSGSITTLSIACFGAIIAVGFFAFYMVQLLGGDQQVQHACDAGTLNLARTALVTPQVPLGNPNMIQTDSQYIPGNQLPYSDFFACIAPYSGINLSNINKILAQALIVADTAATIGTPLARNHAMEVYWAAGNDAAYLRYLLTPQGLIQSNTPSSLVGAYEGSFASPTQSMPALGPNSTLESAFTNLGQQNPFNMLGYSTPPSLTVNGETVAWMDRGGSCSIYVDPNTVSTSTYSNLPLNTASPLHPVLNYTPASTFTPSYIQGYTIVPVSINTWDFSLGFVTDRPQQTTSLANLTDFNANTSPVLGFDPSVAITPSTNLAYLPPNAFQVTCQTLDKPTATGKGGDIINALACAEIGAIGNGNVACIPAGYIRIDNKPQAAASTAANTMVYSGVLTDMFDMIAAAPSTIWVTPQVSSPSAGGASASYFCPNMVHLHKWVAFTKTATTQTPPPAGYELVNGQYYDSSKDPLGPNGCNQLAGSSTGLNSIPDSTIQIAATYTNSNSNQATLNDLLALEEIKTANYNYSFNASKFNMSTTAEITQCLGIGSDPNESNEYNAYTSGSGGSTNIACTFLYPVNDESIDGKEPSWVDTAVAQIQNILCPTAGGSLAANSLFPDGLDAVAKVKFQLMNGRNIANLTTNQGSTSNSPLNYTYTFTYNIMGVDQGKPVQVMDYGMLYIPNLFYSGGNPFASTTPGANASTYLTHLPISLKGTSGNVSLSTTQYAYSPTPAHALATINEALNGPLQYDLTTSTNGVSAASGNHSFDSNQDKFQAFFNTIYKQCLKIKPSCTQSEVLQALGFNADGTVPAPGASNTPTVPMGTSIYLHVSPTTGNFTCDKTLSYATNDPITGAALTPEQPDGNPGTPYTTGFFMISGATGGHTPASQQYNALINTSTDGVTDVYASDDNYHLVMWEKSSNPIQMQNSMTFIPSSGYHNFLGAIGIDTAVKEEQQIGTVTYSGPN
jgi:hypothetical protein